MYITIYNLKIDLYNLNRNAIMTVNLDKGALGEYEYLRDEYYDRFIERLKNVYNLNENFKNENANISNIDVQEYIILNKGEVDNVTKKDITKTTIHCVVEVTYNPIILRQVLKKDFKIKVHNDISIKEYNG